MGKEIVYTIGHSTLEVQAFWSILQAYGIECLVDVRSLPGSRKFPQFNQEVLKDFLEQRGIEYIWLKALGGRRGKAGFESPNTMWRHPAFRNYADYMLTPEFERGIDELLKIAAEKKTAIMCAEKVFFRCHRRLISDWLVAHGVKVIHLFDAARTQEHALSEWAVVGAVGKITYPGD
ncbi:MAG: DUF488 domain-containing protein [Planctomycetaceae bacterium]|nr:DUF488 domain-containing protein [Planctomycetaceae bacterium]